MRSLTATVKAYRNLLSASTARHTPVHSPASRAWKRSLALVIGDRGWSSKTRPTGHCWTTPQWVTAAR